MNPTRLAAAESRDSDGTGYSDNSSVENPRTNPGIRASDKRDFEDTQMIFKSENKSGFKSEFTFHNKYVKDIDQTKLELRRNKVFRIPTYIGRQIQKAISRKNEIIYCVSAREMSVDISDTTGKVYLPLVTKEEIDEKLYTIKDRLVRESISTLHIGAVKIAFTAQFRKGIDSPIKVALIDDRINTRKDCILGAARGNLAYGKFIFTVYPKFGISLETEGLDKVLSLIHEFERSNLMNKGDKIFSVTYMVGYALANSIHSIEYQNYETIELEDVFKTIGNVEKSQFCEIKKDKCDWVIDITQHKQRIGNNSTIVTSGNNMVVKETTSLEAMSRKIDDLKKQLSQIVEVE